MKAFLTAVLSLACAIPLRRAGAQVADTTRAVGPDSVLVRLVDVDIRSAVQVIARFLDRAVVIGSVNAAKVTLETPVPVARAQLVSLLRAVLSSQNMELVADSTSYLVRGREAAPQAVGPVQSQQSAVELFVVRLRHARAQEVAATVNALYGRASALLEPGQQSPTLGDQLKQNLMPAAGAAPPHAVAAVVGRQASLAGDVTIIPDVRANSLLIRASRSDFELIEAAVREVDVRPLQVLIEVLIAEVRKDKSLAFGVDASLPQQKIPRSGTEVTAATTGAGLGDFVLKLMKIGGVDLDATLRAASSRGDVRIVSRPVLVTANNEQAQILVGSQRPFVQVSRTLPTDSPLRDQVVQYKEVGTRLQVLPTISEDGYVMLEVSQEVNAATTETQFDAPIISTRSVQTRMLIKDGQTVALGGLSDRQRDVSHGGVPFLSGIPVVGGLFGRASTRTTETELFVFLTPHVIRSDEDAEELSAPMRKRAERVKP